jgi:hypothetical protein
MAKMRRGATTVTEFPIAAQTQSSPAHGGWFSIPRALGRINNRLYRDHQNYYASVSLNSAAQTSSPILVYTLAPTWYVQGALRAAKKMHDKAMREERKTVKQARWYDFRLDLDIDGAFYDEMLPYGLPQAMTGTAAHSITNGEIRESIVTDASGNDRVFTLRSATGAVRPAGTAYNVFQEYDAMADTPVDNPAVVSGTAPYDDLTAENDTENMANLQFRGDSPPYNRDSFDAYWVQVGELYVNAQGAQSLSTGMFQAPLGLVLLTGPGGSGFGDIDGGVNIDKARLNLHVAPGNYKGVHVDAL